MEWGLEWIFDFVEFSLIFYFVEFSFQALPIRLVGNRVIPVYTARVVYNPNKLYTINCL